MPAKVVVAHDFTCPWCWIGLSQARRLRQEFGVEIEWVGYELFPEELPLPEPPTPKPAPPDDGMPPRPKTPSRLHLAYAAEGIGRPPASPACRRIHNALEAAEFAKDRGLGWEMVERLYIAGWTEGRNIDDPDVIAQIGAGLGLKKRDLKSAMKEKRYRDRIVPFDDDAYRAGVYNVPNFWIDGVSYAEQPYAVLREAVAAWLGRSAPDGVQLYGSLDLPPAPEDRPTVFVNMVATIDGKTTSGGRDETVMDLGSAFDHATMRRIEANAQAVMIGAQTLRATPGLNYRGEILRIVATQSGKLPFHDRFFTDDPDRALVACPKETELPEGVAAVRAGKKKLDLVKLLRKLRRDHGIQRLLVEGGSELNASLIRHDLVDEVFLTVAPKIRLGTDAPTYAGGKPFPKGRLQGYRLLSANPIGDEVFLRYRRRRGEK
ncbi:MAG: dihydrofolate reductase family protein [Fimbriimonadaceae bacterium]